MQIAISDSAGTGSKSARRMLLLFPKTHYRVTAKQLGINSDTARAQQGPIQVTY